MRSFNLLSSGTNLQLLILLLPRRPTYCSIITLALKALNPFWFSTNIDFWQAPPLLLCIGWKLHSVPLYLQHTKAPLLSSGSCQAEGMFHLDKNEQKKRNARHVFSQPAMMKCLACASEMLLGGFMHAPLDAIQSCDVNWGRFLFSLPPSSLDYKTKPGVIVLKIKAGCVKIRFWVASSLRLKLRSVFPRRNQIVVGVGAHEQVCVQKLCSAYWKT